MPTWIVEDATLLYMILITAAIGLGVGFRQTRKRKYLYGAGLALALILVVLFLGLTVMTEPKKLEANFNSMAGAAATANMQGVFAFIAKDFRYGSMDKAAFRKRCDEVVARERVREVVLWDYDATQIEVNKGTASIEFRAKAKGGWSGGYDNYFVRASFVKEADGIWRMRTFTVFNPVNTKDPIAVPGL